MGRETRRAAHATCPCGQGKVTVDISYRDSDWGMTDQEETWQIECKHCTVDYTLVSAGRGYDIVTLSSKAKADALRQVAESLSHDFLASAEVAAIFKRAEVALMALPTMAARYHVLKQHGLASESLATYRKHARNQSVADWLRQYRHFRQLPAIYRLVGADQARPIQVHDQVEVVREAALAVLERFGNIGPVSIQSMLGGGRL